MFFIWIDFGLNIRNGSCTCSSIVFYFYIQFFKNRIKADYLLRNMNKIIGVLLGIISVITLFNIIRFI
jgi:hypothetical protein